MFENSCWRNENMFSESIREKKDLVIQIADKFLTS